MTIFRPISNFSVSSNGGVLLSGRGFWGSGGNFLACGLPWECENRLKWSKWPQKLQKSEKRVSKSCFSQKLLLDSWWVPVIYRGGWCCPRRATSSWQWLWTPASVLGLLLVDKHGYNGGSLVGVCWMSTLWSFQLNGYCDCLDSHGFPVRELVTAAYDIASMWWALLFSVKW